MLIIPAAKGRVEGGKLERDGFVQVRKWNLAHGSVEAPGRIFRDLRDHYMSSGSRDTVKY